uniref:Torsin n=1 Tax=Arion vulgaris TaxID=1028688 RepID=A0A0B6ZB81_9EUPU
MVTITYFILVILLCTAPSFCIEPITGLTATIAAIGSIVYTGYYTFRCRFVTCCDDRWIVQNITGLEHDLALKLHGQHLVQRTVVGHIKGHLRSQNPPKALVLSFHGLTGVGKNFVSSIIADNVYKDGLRSPYVHLISATKEFPHEGMVSVYKNELKSWIEGNVTICERSMFIFDEVDKLPATLLDVIKPYVDYYEHLGGVIYRKAIFIFLSNTGGTDIATVVRDRWRLGTSRESLKLSEVEKIVMSSAINADNHNGLWHSQLISSHLITAYIPFLPLEKRHIRKCITDSLISMTYYSDVSDITSELVDEIMKELTFYPQAEQIFSSTGCKRVMEKIDYVMVDRDRHPGQKSEF